MTLRISARHLRLIMLIENILFRLTARYALYLCHHNRHLLVGKRADGPLNHWFCSCTRSWVDVSRILLGCAIIILSEFQITCERHDSLK